MKTLSKLTIDDLEKNKPFSTFPELQTEYRMIKVKTCYFLQFKDKYRVFGIKTPFTVWRFIPKNPGKWKRYDCPVVFNRPALMLFICNANDELKYFFAFFGKSKLIQFKEKFPNIDFYLDELTREYRKKNDKTEYL